MSQLQITIVFDPSTGQVGVQGSNEVFGNTVVGLGLLEVAKSLLLQQAQKMQEGSRIQPATMLPSTFPVKG